MRSERRAGVDVTWFDSVGELADRAEACRPNWKSCDRGWTGETWEGALAGARLGRLDLVPQAEALLKLVETDVETPRSEWRPARAGAFACAPDALAGHPDAMRRRVRTSSSQAPLRVLVDLVSSASVPAADLVRRGVGAAALAAALGAERHVELHGVVGLSNGRGATRVLVFRVPTAPLDLAAVCGALASGGVARGLGYSVIRDQADTYCGQWLFGYYPDQRHMRRYVASLREVLGAGDGDLVVHPTFSDDPLVRDPVAYLRESLRLHAGREAELW